MADPRDLQEGSCVSLRSRILLKKKLFYWFYRARERTSMWERISQLPLCTPTGNWTRNLLVYGMMFQTAEPPDQGKQNSRHHLVHLGPSSYCMYPSLFPSLCFAQIRVLAQQTFWVTFQKQVTWSLKSMLVFSSVSTISCTVHYLRHTHISMWDHFPLAWGLSLSFLLEWQNSLTLCLPQNAFISSSFWKVTLGREF